MHIFRKIFYFWKNVNSFRDRLLTLFWQPKSSKLIMQDVFDKFRTISKISHDGKIKYFPENMHDFLDL